MRGRWVREYRRITLMSVVVQAVLWLALVGVVVGLLVAAWPLVVASVWAFVAAWVRGWPPRRLVVAAGWCVPMVAVFALAAFLTGEDAWQAAVWSPVYAWVRAWHALAGGRWLAAMVVIAPTAVPLGLLAGGLLWRIRLGLMAAGAAGWGPGAPVAFDERQWRRSVRTAAQRVRAPGGVPLLSRRGNPQLGAVIRAVGHRPRPVLELPYAAVRSHLVLVGTTGAGKTTALVRLVAGFWAAALARFRRGAGARPWVVMVDAKGGFDARDAAERARRALADVSAGRVAIWPDEVSLNLWALPPGRLVEVLTDLVPLAAEGPAAFYSDVLAAVVDLAVTAPVGPPRDSAEFLSRLDAGWLASAWAGMPDRAGEARAAGSQVGDVRLRYRALFTRLGPGFDGDAHVTDFDVLYCIVEGTASTQVGQAQARALTELVADAATSWDSGTQRAGMLVLDEFSAVAGRVPVHELTERCRSLGLSVVVAAQSWQALAADEAARSRLAGSAGGGVVVMRCPDPDALCRLAGTRRVIETGRKMIARGRYGDEGTGRVQHAWVVDPDRVRNFRPGQAAWIYGNACTYVQVAPYRRSPLALTVRPEPVPARPEQAPLAVEAGPGHGDRPGRQGPPLPLPDPLSGGGS
jgi:hypothetical protein